MQGGGLWCGAPLARGRARPAPIAGSAASLAGRPCDVLMNAVDVETMRETEMMQCSEH
jgi:hypothetical protein